MGWNISKTEIQNHVQVWVDYDAQARRLNVTLASVHVPRPKIPLLSEVIDLSTVMADKMYVDFSASGGWGVGTHHYVLGWSFILDGPTPLLDFSTLLDHTGSNSF